MTIDQILLYIYNETKKIPGINFDFSVMDKTLDEWLSSTNEFWACFPHNSYTKKEEVINNCPHPNVYISIIKDNLPNIEKITSIENGNLHIDIGVSYNSIEAVRTFELLNVIYNKTHALKLLNTIKNLKGNWYTQLYYKTNSKHKTSYQKQWGDYTKNIPSPTTIINELQKLEKNKMPKGTPFNNGTISWQNPSMDLIKVSIPLSKTSNWREYVKEALNVLVQCFKLIPPTTINKAMEEGKRKFIETCSQLSATKVVGGKNPPTSIKKRLREKQDTLNTIMKTEEISPELIKDTIKKFPNIKDDIKGEL